MEPPEYILAPYLVVPGTQKDAWWQASKYLYEATANAHSAIPVLRVVACTDPVLLEALLMDVDEDELGLWVSGLDELSASSDGLGAYLTSLSRATAAGKHLFTLYGGFFAVLASACRTEWIIARNWL